MGGTKEEYVRYTQKFIERLYRGDKGIAEKLGAGIQWSLPFYQGFGRAANPQLKETLLGLSKGVEEVTHQDYCAALLEGGHAFVSGIFTAHVREADGLIQHHCCFAHAVFISGRIACLKIAPRRDGGKRLELRNLDRESRFVWEDEIIYIEVMQDHLYWYSRLDVLETTGTLLELEKKLSGCFVRIHRSYMVNVKHVSRLTRYEVSMDNGDILQIPQKKYPDIKKKLQGSLPG